MKTLICGHVLQGGINTSVRHGGIYVKSIIPRGPADKDGQIKIGNMLVWTMKHVWDWKCYNCKV